MLNTEWCHCYFPYLASYSSPLIEVRTYPPSFPLLGMSLIPTSSKLAQPLCSPLPPKPPSIPFVPSSSQLFSFLLDLNSQTIGISATPTPTASFPLLQDSTMPTADSYWSILRYWNLILPLMFLLLFRRDTRLCSLSCLGCSFLYKLSTRLQAFFSIIDGVFLLIYFF